MLAANDPGLHRQQRILLCGPDEAGIALLKEVGFGDAATTLTPAYPDSAEPQVGEHQSPFGSLADSHYLIEGYRAGRGRSVGGEFTGGQATPLDLLSQRGLFFP